MEEERTITQVRRQPSRLPVTSACFIVAVIASVLVPLTTLGQMVLKDMDDAHEGNGWIAGTVVSASTKTLVVSVLCRQGSPCSTDMPTGKKKEYIVTFDNKTSVCRDKKLIADSLVGVSGLKSGQRVSVAFRKGTHTADKIVDQGYQMDLGFTSPTGGTSGGPSMPTCN
jgi:hypothetical protein